MKKLQPSQISELKPLKSTQLNSMATTGTYAAALQDHLIRKSNLKMLNKVAKPLQPKTKLGPNKIMTGGRVISIDQNQTATESKAKSKSSQEVPNVLKEYENIIKKTELNEQKNIQAKLYKYIKKLTLAQRLGIVEKPPQPLTNDDWGKIEEASKKREGDHSCPICLEGFKTPNNQIILSCSHVFHKTCLANFEKFTNARVCPLCRRQDYEKKNFDQGFMTYLTSQVIKVQKVFRGYNSRRKLYAELAKTYKASSTRFRRRLLAYKLQVLNEKMSKKVRTRQKETEKLIVEIDKNLDDKNNVMDKLVEIQNLHRQTQENIREALPNAVLNQVASKDRETNVDIKSNQAWQEAYKVACLRNEKSCAICFNELNNGKKLFLLNCTHVFHSSCLLSFEYYALLNKHCCPVCRSDYKKVEVDHWHGCKGHNE